MEATKTTSARYLMQQVQSRFKVNNTNWRADALDWIGLMVGEIGYHVGYEEKLIELEVSCYKVKIPSSVVAIDSVSKGAIPLASISRRDSVDIRRTGRPPLEVANYEHVLALNKQTDRLEELKQMYLENPSDELLDKMKETRDKIAKLVEGITFHNHFNGLRCNWYLVENGYIRTSFESGCILVDASTFILDAQGLPMVIDTFKYTEACIWGMMWYMMIGGYVHPTLSLEYIEDKKDRFVWQAQNEPKMMSIDRHQEFAETWSSVCRGIDNETLNYL